MAGDRSIQRSYRVRLPIPKHAEMLEKSNARNLAHIPDTSHFFRFVFAEKFPAIENSRILKELARPAGLEPATLGLEVRSSRLSPDPAGIFGRKEFNRFSVLPRRGVPWSPSVNPTRRAVPHP